jgi:hypothetical protein
MKKTTTQRNEQIATEYMEIQKTNTAKFDDSAVNALAKKHDLTTVAIRLAINQFTKTTRVLNIGE